MVSSRAGQWAGYAPYVKAITGGRDTARRIPGAKLRIEPGMGHDIPRALWPALADDLERMAAAATRG